MTLFLNHFMGMDELEGSLVDMFSGWSLIEVGPFQNFIREYYYQKIKNMSGLSTLGGLIKEIRLSDKHKKFLMLLLGDAFQQITYQTNNLADVYLNTIWTLAKKPLSDSDLASCEIGREYVKNWCSKRSPSSREFVAAFKEKSEKLISGLTEGRINEGNTSEEEKEKIITLLKAEIIIIEKLS